MGVKRDPEKHYVPSEPCPHGHWLRYKKGDLCVECVRQRQIDSYNAEPVETYAIELSRRWLKVRIL